MILAKQGEVYLTKAFDWVEKGLSDKVMTKCGCSRNDKAFPTGAGHGFYEITRGGCGGTEVQKTRTKLVSKAYYDYFRGVTKLKMGAVANCQSRQEIRQWLEKELAVIMKTFPGVNWHHDPNFDAKAMKRLKEEVKPTTSTGDFNPVKDIPI